jgi:hypothetical protein
VKVSRLIEILSKYPPDSEVALAHPDSGWPQPINAVFSWDAERNYWPELRDCPVISVDERDGA